MTFSVVAGGSEEPRIPILFPKAKLITTTGQVVLGAEPVRAKRADVWMSGDSDVLLFAKRNAQWAVVIEPDKPIDKRPNTWAVRYGDSEWKQFLDFWGRVRRRSTARWIACSSRTWRSSAPPDHRTGRDGPRRPSRPRRDKRQ